MSKRTKGKKGRAKERTMILACNAKCMAVSLLAMLKGSKTRIGCPLHDAINDLQQTSAMRDELVDAIRPKKDEKKKEKSAKSRIHKQRDRSNQNCKRLPVYCCPLCLLSISQNFPCPLQ